MNAAPTRWPAGLAVLLLTVLAAGCAADGGYVYGGGGPVFAGNYYEPFGFDYGGWGPGYRVGPFYDHGFHGDFHGAGGFRSGSGHVGGHAFAPAAASHGVPFIPMGHRGSGGHR